ncbi:MAG: HipA N-terminal domain-containing protein [bacterium]|jgi:HipA-like protein
MGWTRARRCVCLRRPAKKEGASRNILPATTQNQFDFVEGLDEGGTYEYGVLVTNETLPIVALAQLYRDRADCENVLVSYRYEQDWLRQPHALPLSRSLPLQGEAFEGKKARPFFAGILPEEGPRQRIASILGISERNDFAMLERIGGVCGEIWRGTRR